MACEAEHKERKEERKGGTPKKCNVDSFHPNVKAGKTILTSSSSLYYLITVVLSGSRVLERHSVILR